MKSRIVVLGASFAGLEAAAEVCRLGRGRVKVTVIDRKDTFEFRPSLPWVVYGQREPRHITVPLRPLVESRGAEFIQARVESIDPRRSLVWTDAGPWPYDFLVLALGATSPPAFPEYLEGRAYTHLWLQEAIRLRQRLESFQGGDVAVAFHPRSSLLCAAWEMIFQLDQYLRRRGIRNRSRLTMITYESKPFEWTGPLASGLVARWLEQNDIDLHTFTFVEEAGDGWIRLADGTELANSLLILTPPYAGPPVVRDVPGLTDTEGFVITDGYLRSATYPNIYGAGDIVARPGPKTGLLAELQGRTAARNIAAQYGWTEAEEFRSFYACLSDLGVRRGLLKLQKPAPQQGEAKTYLVWPGWIPHAAKIALEAYFTRVRLRARR